jgi:hypothetical protein
MKGTPIGDNPKQNSKNALKIFKNLLQKQHVNFSQA